LNRNLQGFWEVFDSLDKVIEFALKWVGIVTFLLGHSRRNLGNFILLQFCLYQIHALLVVDEVLHVLDRLSCESMVYLYPDQKPRCESSSEKQIERTIVATDVEYSLAFEPVRLEVVEFGCGGLGRF